MKYLFGLYVFLLLVVNTSILDAQTCVANETLNKQYGRIKFSYSTYSYWNINRAYSWKILVPPKSEIEIKFSNFMTATCVGTKKCTCTYIAIKDGECANSTVIGQYCGHQITSGTLSPSGGYIRLVFVSHSRNSTNIWNRFDVMYAIGMKCAASRLSEKNTMKCPNDVTKLTHNKCCYYNQTNNCCFHNGTFCRENTASRNYCPRRSDDNSKGTCCVDDGYPSCCSTGGNYCNDKGVHDRTYCPRPGDEDSKRACCIINGESSCCSDGGNYCNDEGLNNRSYCPRPQDEDSMSACCITSGQPSCCYGGGNHCNDEGVHDRTYCPRTEEERINGSLTCCMKDGNASCCPKSVSHDLPSCTEYLIAQKWTNDECMLLWFSVALASLLVILVALYVCWKWPLYHCLTYPFRECLKHLADMFRALYRWFKVIAFYASLFVTTVVFTFGCCCCFIVIHEWPWVRAHTIVSERFGIDTPIWYLKCVNSKTSPENNPSEEYSDDADSDENNPPEDDSL